MKNYKYYFFIAMGNGENDNISRETLLKIDLSDINEKRPARIIERTVEYYSCQLMLFHLLEILKDSHKMEIDPLEIYIVPLSKWNSPDIGKVREYDFSNMEEFFVFASKISHPVEQYMKKEGFLNWKSLGFSHREGDALIGQLVELGDKKKKLFGFFG